MSDYITTAFLLVILLINPLQTSLDTYNYENMQELQRLTNNVCEVAKLDGYFTDENLNNYKTELLSKFKGLNESDIVIECTKTPVYRGESTTINFKVTVPLKRIIFSSAFYGISKENNSANKVIDVEVYSERLR